MTSNTPAASEAAHHKGPSNHGDLVTVEINGKPKIVKKAKYTGHELKQALEVPVEHELEQVIGVKFVPIANDADIKIKGGEKFVSHVGQGQAS